MPKNCGRHYKLATLQKNFDQCKGKQHLLSRRTPRCGALRKRHIACMPAAYSENGMEFLWEMKVTAYNNTQELVVIETNSYL